MMKNLRIVDCDVHVRELPDELARHCEMPWRKALEWRGRLLPFFKERPGHYLRNFRFSTQPAEEPEHPRDYVKLLDLISTFTGNHDNVIYASDWPHHDFLHPDRLRRYPMPDEVRRQIMGANAAEFFGIPPR